MPKTWRCPVVIGVWEKREEDVCGKKEGNGTMGNLGIFGVCGNK